jgi:hypothetical protein
VTTALTFLVIRLHERWMSEERLERAWPPASRDAAIILCGLFALPFHFARTLGNLRSASGVGMVVAGFALGLGAAFVVAFASELLVEGIAWALGISIPD